MIAHLMCPTARELEQAHVDITKPLVGVEVVWNHDNTTLWVNVDGVCVLRICRIPVLGPRREAKEEAEMKPGSAGWTIQLANEVQYLREVEKERMTAEGQNSLEFVLEGLETLMQLTSENELYVFTKETNAKKEATNG